jgi:hypothetical protein
MAHTTTFFLWPLMPAHRSYFMRGGALLQRMSHSWRNATISRAFCNGKPILFAFVNLLL